MRYDKSKGQPQISQQLLVRVLGYARPYWRSLALMLVAVGVTALVGLIPPLLYRDLIDNVLPNRDFSRLNWLALGMIGILSWPKTVVRSEICWFNPSHPEVLSS